MFSRKSSFMRGGLRAPLVFVAALASCSTLKYEADIGFLNSAQANSKEALVHINDALCKDMNGKPGLCATRIRSDLPLRFRQHAMPYGYKLVFTCSSAIGADDSWSVPAGQDFEFHIKPIQFSTVRLFTCIGEIFPQDRLNELSAAWSVRAEVVDAEYKPRESIYHTGSHLVLGQHAKYAVVCDPKCKNYKKKTYVRASKNARAWSESEVMRFNFYGL